MYITEYLPRLNKISVATDYAGKSLQDIKRLSLQDQSIVVATEKIITTIQLPIQLTNQPQITNLQLTKDGCLTFSLIVSSEGTPSTNETESFMSQTSQRWSCKDLKVKTPKSEVGNYNEFTFNCSTCEYVIIDSKDFKFLDMPSEFWYELMDYWHCHKPDNHDHHEKNYNGSLKPPNDKTIVIGSNYLLVKFTDTIDSIESKVLCHSCHTLLGENFEGTDRIFKWNINLSYKSKLDEPIKESFSSYVFVYDLFVNRINSTASRKFKFIVNNTSYYFWVLAIGIDVSIENTILKNSLKLVFRSEESSDTAEEDDEYEYLSIPYAEIFHTFYSHITDINKTLPACNKYVLLDSTKYIVSYLSPI